jgi:mRNA-degrading endonuclease RelE of RelBE toxin-antitoxin system
MFTISCSDSVVQDLQEAAKIATSIPSKIEELSVTPLANAIPIEVPYAPQYYVNAGRFCILFNIDPTTSDVEIIRVVSNAYLYKVITRRITFI